MSNLLVKQQKRKCLSPHLEHPPSYLSAISTKRKHPLVVIDLCTPPPQPSHHVEPPDAKRPLVVEKMVPFVSPPPNPDYDDSEGHYICNPQSVLGKENRYIIMNVLGQGTFSKVVRAWDHVDRKYRAIKIVKAIQTYRDASRIELRVLNHIKRTDPHNMRRCIHIQDSFDHLGHICMVFELLSTSVYDFQKHNAFHPFTASHIRHFAHQILYGVSYLHGQKLIHTDLKPENLMLVSSDCAIKPSTIYSGRTSKELIDSELMLIDFGSTTFENEHHSRIIGTRHYRAPEVILSMGWSYPSDMWSIGCILVEMYTGAALFQTHANLEHLAIMEKVLGPFPIDMVNKLDARPKTFFRETCRVDFPTSTTEKADSEYVAGLKPLQDLIRPEDGIFFDLVRQLLAYDPQQRITADGALQHPYLRRAAGVLGA